MWPRLATSVACVFLLTAAPAAEARPQEFAFGAQYGQYDTVVEQQSPDFFHGPGLAPETWVRNPPTVPWCGWDVDDRVQLDGYGRLDGTASGTLCTVADGFDQFWGDDHTFQVEIRSGRPITATLTSSEGLSKPVPETADGLYQSCHTDRTAGPFAEIPGSNGGTGRVVDYTLTITGTRATVNARFAVVGITWNSDGPC